MAMSLKSFARSVGILFLVVGLLGFFIDDLFGLLHFDMLHNVIHLVVGLLGLFAARGDTSAKLFAKTLGYVYVVIGVIGFIVPGLFGLMELELGDNILHLVVGAYGLYLAYTSTESA
jgi:hypothetical protein